MVKDRAPQVQINRLNELRRWSEFLKMPINVEPKYFPPDGLPANKLIIAAIILKKMFLFLFIILWKQFG